MEVESIIHQERAGALAQYPHAKRVGSLVFVSGVSSRRADNTHEGVMVLEDGTVRKDIKGQTRAVIQNIEAILKSAGLDLTHVVDMTTFLVDMKDFTGYNAIYNEFFSQETGPSRTTVAVHQLPHPHLLIEMKAIACDPSNKS